LRSVLKPIRFATNAWMKTGVNPFAKCSVIAGLNTDSKLRVKHTLYMYTSYLIFILNDDIDV